VYESLVFNVELSSDLNLHHLSLLIPCPQAVIVTISNKGNPLP
jgi:hypothetical protein